MRNRIIIYILSAIVAVFVWTYRPQATELEDFTLLKLPPGRYGSLRFTSPTMIVLSKSGTYEFGDVICTGQTYPKSAVIRVSGVSATGEVKIVAGKISSDGPYAVWYAGHMQ